MKKKYFSVLFLAFLSTACGYPIEVSEYSFDGRKILRQDWNDVMTELKYYNSDGAEIGTALFYYPGRDGWFLVDNIWDTDKVFLLLCDACPKINILDSSQFEVVHDIAPVQHIDKKRWIRISNNDNFPVVQQKNKEYNSEIRKKTLQKGESLGMPDWSIYPGTFFVESK